MRNIRLFVAGGVGMMAFALPLAFASALSISIQSIDPGSTVPARTAISFTIVPSLGFSPRIYALYDAFGTSTVSASNINSSGQFMWVPTVADVGTHPLTITASDNFSNVASTTETVIVTPPPSLVISSLSPGTTVLPGGTLTFAVTASGFTNPSFSPSDSFSGTSISSSNINAAGSFSWTPDQSQNGEHVITIYGSDSLGHAAYGSQTVRVGVGPSLTIQLLPASARVSPGQTVTFITAASNYWPTSFSVIDTFSGTTVTNNNINTSGSFSWSPLAADAGTHVLTVTGVVGAYGERASATTTIVVLGPNGVPVPAPVPTPTPTPALASSTAATTTADASTISALQAQIAAVQAQIAAASAASPIASSELTFSSNLSPGQTGDNVMRLQVVLSKRGFLTATPNGRYGPATTAAVKKFQAAKGLPQLGIVGPATRAALGALSSGSSNTAGAGVVGTTASTSSAGDGYVFENFISIGNGGTDVLELQKRLFALGFLSVEPTGKFGAATEAAVKAFQKAHGIRAAGYVGPSTRAALNQ